MTPLPPAPPRRDAPLRVLILSASYGSGHNEAARNLASAFGREGVEARVVDHFRDLVGPRFERLSRGLYTWMLRRAPIVWGAAYGLGDRMPSDSPFTFGMTRVGLAGLSRLLATFAPDAVVTVHATPTIVLSSLAAEGRSLPPHVTVVTDFVAHSQWIAPAIDDYCVAADEVRHELIARGIPGDRIVVTGVPVRAEFESPSSRVEARRALGLPLDVPVVLAMAGSQGAFGRLPDVARVLGRSRRPLHAVLVAGRNPRLARRLRELARGTAAHVFEYVSNVRTLMAAADLVVTKAGGMTLAEALAAGVPVLAYGSLAGQERRNERFASRAGVALVSRTPRELARTLDRALGDPALLADLGEHAARIGRPAASRHVVATVLARIEAGRLAAGAAPAAPSTRR
jgi:processive 1,2-diacylglycerol beta-glucosyltransferase